MACSRRVSLVLCGLSIAGMALFVLLPKSGSQYAWSPADYDNAIKHFLPSLSNKTVENFTQEERSEIKKCIAEFPKLRFENTIIDRPKMEITRVKSHSYLNRNSRVLEVGGYTGEDAAKLIREYDPHYIAMEPIPRFQKILMERFKENPKFQVLGIGIGKENKTLYLNIDSDATSLFRKKKASKATTQEVAQIREISMVIKELRVEESPIDLFTINCEGCEYDLLELLTTSKFVNYFKNIQFQFHVDLPGIEKQELRYCTIMSLLSRTHEPTFQYAYTWQSWRQRKERKSLYH